MSKPRSDSKLDALDMDQQGQLCEWLLTPGLGYERVKKLVFEEFGVSTSWRALSLFYHSYVAPFVIEHRRRAVGLAKEVGAELKRQPGEFSQATIDALEQKAFELAQNPMCDPKDVKAIFSLVLKSRDQMLNRDKFEEQRSRNAEAKKQLEAVKKAGGLTAETLAQIEEAAALL